MTEGEVGRDKLKPEGLRRARVVVMSGGRTQAQAVLSQMSYHSHDDLRLHFRLGK